MSQKQRIKFSRKALVHEKVEWQTLVHTLLNMVIWYVMMPCVLAGGYQYHREAHCLHPRGNCGIDLPHYMALHTRYCNYNIKYKN